MAYDQNNSYQAPTRAYYGRQNQRPDAPQTQGYDQQYSHGQDSGYYSQGGYDQYNDGYANDGHWNNSQQQYHDQGHGQGYQNHSNNDSQSRFQQSRSPPQQMGYGQGRGQQPSSQQPRPAPRNYGPGAPIRANAPPPDRQNVLYGQPQQQQQQQAPRDYHRTQQSPPPQNFPQQRPPPQQNPYSRAESRQDGYNRQNDGFSPVDSRAPPAPWNNNGGRNSPGPGERPPASAPWTNNGGRSSPGPGRSSPAPGRNSPFEPIGGRPGARSRGERERMEAQRRGPLNEMRRDSQLTLPMDNPFPMFPTKKAEAKKKLQAQQPILEEGMSKVSLDKDRPRPSLDTRRQNTIDVMQARPATAQSSRMDPPARPGTAQGNSADRREHGDWDPRPPRTPGQQQQKQQQAPDGYHAPQQQGSWPLSDEPTPPRAQFSVPDRPSTATGVREGAGPQSPPFNGNTQNQQYQGQRPQARRRSTEESFGNTATYGRPSYDSENYSQGQTAPGQQGRYGQQQQSPAKQSPPKAQQYGAAYARNPHETMGYSGFGANPYMDEPSDMPNFDSQPANNRHEHAISMHLDGNGGPVQNNNPGVPSSGLRNGYSANDPYDDGYNQGGQQLYAQSAASQPNLRGDNGGYGNGYGYGYGNGNGNGNGSGYGDGSGSGHGNPAPNRGPGMGPRGRGMPPGGMGRGRGGPPGRPGAPPMSRLQTADSQWSDPGPRGQTASPMSAGGRMYGQPRQQTQSPDALPPHSTPIRPGHMEGGPNSKPPPVRQYNNPNTGPNANAGTPRQSTEQSRSSTSSAVSTGPVTHEEIQRLQAAVRMDTGDHKTALALAKRLIEAASSDLVSVHQDPKARQKAREKFIFDAHKMVKKLVQQQYPEAMFFLADCHGQGLMGLSPDPKEAFQLYQAAAKLGHPASAYRTAVCCEMGADEGGGTRKDPLKAVQWYRRAASLGDPAAMYKLGMVLLKGLLGQQRNVGEAVNWLTRASERADKDNPHSLHELGLLYAAPPNDSKLIRDDKYAAQLFERAARLGYKFSQFRLGEAFEYGLMSLPIDQRSSIAWYSKAAAQGEHQSELALSGWYLTGAPGILEQSDTEAYLWARKAAQAELAKGLFALGYFTEVGIGCARSLEEAKRWYGRAAALRYPKAQERLDELKRGGYKAQKSRERLSRSDRKQQEDNCTVM